MTDEQKMNNQGKVRACQKHLRSKEAVRALRREDKDRSREKDAMALAGENVSVITFDLPKIL